MARGRKKAQSQESPLVEKLTKASKTTVAPQGKVNGNGEARVEPLAHVKARDRMKLEAILGVLKGAGYKTSEVHEGAWYRARVLPK